MTRDLAIMFMEGFAALVDGLAMGSRLLLYISLALAPYRSFCFAWPLLLKDSSIAVQIPSTTSRSLHLA